ncbi:MAG: hypothetical protein E7650_05545 [Ruminococcaceae bacterium]|nr:hypothetical protein [Oscillospiraceae bacterium]
MLPSALVLLLPVTLALLPGALWLLPVTLALLPGALRLLPSALRLLPAPLALLPSALLSLLLGGCWRLCVMIKVGARAVLRIVRVVWIVIHKQSPFISLVLL